MSAAKLPDHYRFHDSQDFDRVVISCVVYKAIAETPAGYWVVPAYFQHYPADAIKRHRKWVPKASHRRFCYPTKAEAFESFRARKRRHIARLKHSLTIAEQSAGKADEVAKNTDAINAITEYACLDCGTPAAWEGVTFYDY